MTEDIIINGVSVKELKETREKIKKDATKIVSDCISKARVILDSIVDTNDDDEYIFTKEGEELQALAQEAYDLLDTADTVAGVADIEYCIPYFNRNYDYYDDAPYTHQLEELVSWDDKTSLGKLVDLLENMESKSQQWNDSTC